MPTLTRRQVVHTVGTVAGSMTLAARRATAAISYTVQEIRELADGTVASPDGYSYDAYEWNGTAVLEFEDSEHIEFGDENYPPEPTPTPTATPTQTPTPAPGTATPRDGADGTDLPMRINLGNMQTGVAVFLVGIIGLLGGASAVFRNPAGGIMTGLSVVLLIAAGLFGFGLQLFWIGVILTALLLVVGVAARWST